MTPQLLRLFLLGTIVSALLISESRCFKSFSHIYHVMQGRNPNHVLKSDIDGSLSQFPFHLCHDRNFKRVCKYSSRVFAMHEGDRRAEYDKRNYTWPLRENDYKPSTSGWKTLLERRFEQISRVTDVQERYNAWLTAITSAVVVQNFTENGWGLTRAPQDLVKELKESLRNGMNENRTRFEEPIEIIETKDDKGESDNLLRPLFIDQPELNEKVLRTLQPFHSEWSSTELSPEKAYGLRIYRNNSALLMHCDKPNTHIIAGILHIDHSEDSKPWPLVIEDFQGNTNEVVMESGDLLLFEGSKCLHGRPQKFDGSWYCSIFTHYYPKGWDTENRHWESHYAIPPNWIDIKDDNDNITPLQVVGTGLTEPKQKHGWEALKSSIKWNGPASEEVVTTGDSMK